MADNFDGLGTVVFIFLDWTLKRKLNIFIMVSISYNRLEFVLEMIIVMEAPTCLA